MLIETLSHVDFAYRSYGGMKWIDAEEDACQAVMEDQILTTMGIALRVGIVGMKLPKRRYETSITKVMVITSSRCYRLLSVFVPSTM